MHEQPEAHSAETNAPIAHFDLGAMYQHIQTELHAAELRAAELRGQLQLLQRLIGQAQRPILSGDALGEQQS